MALSSSFSKAFGPQNRYKLLIEWKADQDISGNKSTITAKAYLDTEKYGTMYASAQKTGSISIAGQSGGISKTGISNDGNEKTYLDEITKTVTHDSDGSKSLTISAYFDFEVSLSGQWIGRVTASDNITLNTIPRASSLSAGQNFTAGGNISASVSRASSKFRHELEYYVKTEAGDWDWILQIPLTASQTSKNYTPTVAEKTEMFRHLNKRGSAQTRVILQTYNGSTHIGSTEKIGTIKAPAASTITFPASFNVGSTITGKINRNDNEFLHNIHLMDGNTKESQVATNEETAYSWNTSELYNDMKTAKSKTYKLRVFTMYNGVQVQEPRDYNVTAKITGSNPKFTGAFTYRDTNAKTIEITKDNQKIIQGQSTVRVTIPAAAKATAQNGATMSKYIVTVNGVEKSANYSTSDINIDYGIINAAANVAITVKAVDSRGNSTSSSKTATILPYKAPVITFTAERVNGFEDATNIKINGTYSQLLIGGVAQNGPSTISAKFAIQERPSKGYGNQTNMTLTIANGKISGSAQIVLSKEIAYDVQLILADKFTSKTYVHVVSKGRPIFHIDEILNALGFNIFPTEANTFLMDGKLVFTAGKNGSGSAAIDLNNGDIWNMNSAYMNDVADAEGEGFNWLKKGKTAGSRNPADYDNFRIVDGVGQINGKPVFRNPDANNSLWNGVALMNNPNSAIKPTKPLDQCANGWIMLWADYAGDNKADDANYIPSYVHKSHAEFNSGDNSYWLVSSTANNLAAKTLYITNTQITGHNDNDGNAILSDIVLVRVLEW